MKIYISHLRRGDYEKELYMPLLASELAKKHTFIFPHNKSQKPFNTKELFEKKGCDLVLAEISYPATGRGIELGWANMFQIPIYCIYKKGMDVSGSALSIAAKSIKYSDSTDLIVQLTSLL
jgi:hypothetical protein